MSNLNEEASIRLLGKLTLLLPMLEQNLSLQLEAKKVIDETLYDYEVQSKCTDLVASDIEEKACVYIACKRLEGLSEKTLKNYTLFLIKLNQFFNKPCSTIETMDLRMFLAVLGKGKQATTINGYITMLKGFFGWLQAEEYLNSGMRIEGVQGILGHTTPSTTQIYAQLSQENLKNEYRKLVI